MFAEQNDIARRPIVCPLGTRLQDVAHHNTLVAKVLHTHSELVDISQYKQFELPTREGCRAARLECPLCDQHIDLVMKGNHVEIFVVDAKQPAPESDFKNKADSLSFEATAESMVEQPQHLPYSIAARQREIPTTTKHEQPRSYRCRHSNKYPKQIRRSQYRSVQKFVKHHNYKSVIDWPDTDQAPRLLLAASPAMLQHYSDYGDVVFFDCNKSLHASSHIMMVGHFSVRDRNSRLLLTAVTLFRAQDTDATAQVIQEFFKINSGRLPKTIITNCKTGYYEIARTLESLGVHYLLNPHTIVKQLCRKKKNPASEETIEQLKRAMITREPSQYLSLMSVLQKYPTVRDVVEENSNTFYCANRDVYFGLRIDNGAELKEYLKLFLVDKIRPTNLLSRTHVLSEKLDSQSKIKDYYLESGGDSLFADARLELVRMRLERQPFSRFMENYNYAKHKLQVICEDQSVTLVQERSNLATYLVRDWQCDCQELQKTGIPCSHLLAVACKNGKAYTELICSRWMNKENSFIEI